MIQPKLHLALCSVLLSASIGASAATPTVKPLQISGVLQEQVGPTPRCPTLFGGAITGHGASELLGRVVFLATDCITPVPPLFNFSQGRMIIMTMTGEQIFASYSGQFVPTGDGAKYVFSGATFQVTGGSGQYAKATGGGTLSGGEDMATGAGTVQLTGQITYEEKR